MKKAIAEVGSEQVLSGLVARLDEIERRLERLDPRPKPEVLEPYEIGSSVFSVSDADARHALIVRGYDRPGYVLVTVSHADPDRSLPLASVRTRKECPHAQTSPSEAFEHITDPVTRKFLEGRAKARFDATTRPFNSPEPTVPQRRYIDAAEG